MTANNPGNQTTRSDHFIGKHLLVGITYLNRDGHLAGHEQFHGRILNASHTAITIRRADTGLPASLPPAAEPAPPGRYRLESTGEVIVDPDFIAEWTFIESLAS